MLPMLFLLFMFFLKFFFLFSCILKDIPILQMLPMLFLFFINLFLNLFLLVFFYAVLKIFLLSNSCRCFSCCSCFFLIFFFLFLCIFKDISNSPNVADAFLVLYVFVSSFFILFFCCIFKNFPNVQMLLLLFLLPNQNLS